MPKHRVDEYGHILVDNGNKRVRDRINHLAKSYASLKGGEGNEARIVSIRTELMALSVSFFRVIGQGMGGNNPATYDDTFMDTLKYCLKHYDPKKAPFINYVRYKYKKMIKTAAEEEDERQERLVEFAELSKDDVDSGVEADVRDGFVQPEYVVTDRYEDGSVHQDMDSAIVEFIALVIDFLDHAPDRSHNQRAKLYLKMDFTEWATYAIKIHPTFDYCRSFEQQQTRVFFAVEDGFLNVYMSRPCETVREVWDTDLREGYGEIIRHNDPRMNVRNPPAPWKLEISVHLDYLATLGITVTDAVISQHRNRFEKLKEQLSVFA